MQKFSLRSAQPGKEILTRSGKNVEILVTKRDSKDFPIVAILNNKEVLLYTLEGKFYKDKDSDNDLFIK